VADALPVIYLARHGETAWTLSGQHTGLTDIALTDRGEDNARRLGERLKGLSFVKVFTSPLQRAARTCELAGFGAAAALDRDLVEWNYGQYEGQRTVEIRAQRPESCRRVVRENVEAGSDWIKVTVSGSGGEATGQADAEPIMFPDEVRAVMEAARATGRPVAAHAHSVAAIKLALESGARTIDHGTYFDASSVRLFKAKRAFLVPTAYVAEFVSGQLQKFSEMPGRLPAEGLKRWTQAAMATPGRAWRAGVRMGVGSDSGSAADAHATAREVELYVAAGVPAAEAIKAATANGAEILGVQDRIGRIKPGFEADLIAVAGDPLQDISKLRTVSFVMKGGAVARAD